MFGLRYDAFAHVYLGTCRQDNATITYRFDGGWTWDRGDATGTFKGDLLEVRYSDIMQQSNSPSVGGTARRGACVDRQTLPPSISMKSRPVTNWVACHT